jgi:hypothetical protein
MEVLGSVRSAQAGCSSSYGATRTIFWTGGGSSATFSSVSVRPSDGIQLLERNGVVLVQAKGGRKLTMPGILGNILTRKNVHQSCRASLQPLEETTEQVEEEKQSGTSNLGEISTNGKIEKEKSKGAPINKELNQVVMKTAATFAPRASTVSKNPAQPGTNLYKIFEAQAYMAMVFGGALSFNLLFPGHLEADIWRLMGM